MLVGEDKEGALMVFPAQPRGWTKQSAFKGSKKTLEEIPVSRPGLRLPGAVGGKARDPTGQPSVYQIIVRVTADERDLWLVAAGEDSLANWIRSTLTNAARTRVKGKP